MPPTIVSAPGKVLLAGGYLVLDPAYSGIVVSTSARFYTAIENMHDDKTDDVGESEEEDVRICVRSPQFLDAEWEYSVNLSSNGAERVTVIELATTRNKFVRLALQCTLNLVLEIKGREFVEQTLGKGMQITIVGGNDFYSQRAQSASGEITAPSQLPPFALTNVQLAKVHKTGLGSSAALITSLVCALLYHFDIIPAESLSEKDDDGSLVSSVAKSGRNLAHNAAQYVHCLAQGKVGSGFDVASAVFGSHIYTRFNPAVLDALMGDNSFDGPLFPILSASNPDWDYKILPFRLPPLFRLVLGEVDAGSDTPSLVGKVLKWRQDCSSEANRLWTELARANMDLARLFAKLSELHSSDTTSYSSAILRAETMHFGKTDIVGEDGHHMIIQTLRDARTRTEEIRRMMREMGQLSGVPIEPQEQTDLLDACIAEPGIIGGGVPGAGGYDAIWLLVLDASNSNTTSSPVVAIKNTWTQWRMEKKFNVSPLSAVESLEKGARLETSDVPGLSNLLLSI